jgi:hypothetical protein
MTTTGFTLATDVVIAFSLKTADGQLVDAPAMTLSAGDTLPNELANMLRNWVVDTGRIAGPNYRAEPEQNAYT